MPRVAIRPSRDLANLFRQRRKELNLTLREAEEKTRTYGKVIPFSTLGKVEQGRVDPGVIRFQQLLEIYDIPQEMALELVAIETHRADLPKKAQPQELFDEALRLWKGGQSARAIAFLYALREAAGNDPRFSEVRQQGQLQLAVVVGRLGRVQLSKHLIEQLLAEEPSASLVLRCLIQLAVCWERLGVQELALAVLARAETHAASASPRDVASFSHERGLIELSLHLHEPARDHLEKAKKLYKAARDERGAIKVSFSLVRVLLASGQAKAAVRAAQELLEASASSSYKLIRPEATVLLGVAHFATGQVDQAVATLRAGLGDAVTADDASARFLAHHYLAQAYAAAGDHDRAAAEEHAAQQFRKYVEFEPDPVVFEGGKTHGTSDRAKVGQRKHRHH